MDHFEKTVRAIYKANDVATFGVDRGSEELPPEWEAFFRKSREGLRNQDQPEPEPEKEADPEILSQIFQAIIKRIEEIEARLDLIEVVGAVQEKIEEQSEPVRKGLDPEIFLFKMQLDGACGELRTREGRQWQRS